MYLKDVIFEDFSCGDAIRIGHGARLGNVVVLGKSPRTVRVKMSDRERRLNSAQFAIDVSRYLGEVEMYGFDIKDFCVDKNRHVVLKKDRFADFDWREFGSKRGYFGLGLLKIKSEQASCGVFSLPKANSKSFQEVSSQLEVLKRCGLIEP